MSLSAPESNKANVSADLFVVMLTTLTTTISLIDWVLAEIVLEAAQKSHICGVTGTSGVDASRTMRSSEAVDVDDAAVGGCDVVLDWLGETTVSTRFTLVFFFGG